MKLIALSDLHGYLPDIPKCDVAVFAGDVCPAHNHELSYQSEWLERVFRPYLLSLPAQQIVGIAGNHDFAVVDLPWTYLENSGCEIMGVKFWGSPYTVPFGNWAFQANDFQRGHIWRSLPDGTHIVVSHGPAYGHCDFAPPGEHTGCRHLLSAIERVQPKLLIHGHIHEGRGLSQVGNTTIANVTMLDGQYRPIHSHMMFEV